MEIRAYRESDLTQIISLFYETVHSDNKQDYSQEQLDAWAPFDEMKLKLEAWKHLLSQNITFVAELNGSKDTEASITAKPFFERQGYQLIMEQSVERKGVWLVNYRMSKKLM